MNFRRRSARTSSLEKIKNSRIRQFIHVKQDVVQMIERNKQRWYGHVPKRKEERIPKIPFE